MRASGVVPGRSSGSLGGPVRDPVCNIRDLQDLAEGSGARWVRVPAKPVVGVQVQAVVERIRCLLLRIPNLGRIRFFFDRPECQSAGWVADAATRTYRRLVLLVLRTMRRRHRHCQKSLAKGNPRHEGTVVPAGIRDLGSPGLEWAIRGRIPLLS